MRTFYLWLGSMKETDNSTKQQMQEDNKSPVSDMETVSVAT